MQTIAQALIASPFFAILGALTLATIVLIPVVLRLAGLTGVQIVEVLRFTLQFFISIVDAYRNNKPLP